MPPQKLVAIRSVEPLASLRARPGMNERFLAQISGVHLLMTKTFGEYKREGKLQYFLDSLSAVRS